MHRSGTQHALRLGVVLAFCALAAVACGAPEVAKPRPLPEDTRELDDEEFWEDKSAVFDLSNITLQPYDSSSASASATASAPARQ